MVMELQMAQKSLPVGHIFLWDESLPDGFHDWCSHYLWRWLLEFVGHLI